MPATTASSAPASASLATAGAIATPARRITEINWQEEYSEVLGDLKRTAVLAVIMIAVMGALSFIIR